EGASPSRVCVGVDSAIQCDLLQRWRVHHLFKISDVDPAEVRHEMRLRLANQIVDLQVSAELTSEQARVHVLNFEITLANRVSRFNVAKVRPQRGCYYLQFAGAQASIDHDEREHRRVWFGLIFD